MNNKAVTRQVVLSQELDKKLLRAAELEYRTISQMLRVMVEDYLKRKKRK